VDTVVDFLVDPATRWIPASCMALVIALAAYQLHSLTPDGVVATTLVGGTIVGTGGWWLGVVLIAFFVTSSALSHGGPAGDHEQRRGKRRDAVQVLANGGVPVLFSMVSALANDPRPWILAAVAAIAGAAADTWATETGRRGKGSPRLITNWRSVPKGTSGAISLHGTVGSALGSAVIAVVAAIGFAAGWLDVGPGSLIAAAIVTGCGLAGSLADSLLGATVQARYWCPTCATTTEQIVHRCGTRTQFHGGIRWLDNDVVNAASIAAAGLLALALSL
jgi:uncharacterized protein (TIGR00297 family)